MKKYIFQIFRGLIWFCAYIYELCKTKNKRRKSKRCNNKVADVDHKEEV